MSATEPDPPGEPSSHTSCGQFPADEVASTFGAQPKGGGGVYDPGEHTVAEVGDYIAAHPDEEAAVLAAEAAGKNRTSLTGG